MPNSENRHLNYFNTELDKIKPYQIRADKHTLVPDLVNLALKLGRIQMMINTDNVLDTGSRELLNQKLQGKKSEIIDILKEF